MSEGLSATIAAEQTALLKIFEDAMVINAECTPGDPVRRIQLDELTAFAASEFVGRSVRVSPSIHKDRPITAWSYATPYPIAGKPGFRPQSGVIIRRNPAKAIGSIEELDLRRSTLKVRPRPWSPYRADRGYFLIDMLTESRERRANVEFLDQS